MWRQKHKNELPQIDAPIRTGLILQRILRLTQGVARTQVVVSAKDQKLPPLDCDVITTSDKQPDRGPLEGIAAGLSILPNGIEQAFVTSCDVPLLSADVVRFMFDQLDAESDIVVPREKRFFHPLLAVYRPAVLQEVQSLLEQDKLRPFFLFERVKTKTIDIDSLQVIDPDLKCLRNLNHPSDYVQALSDTGYEIDQAIKKRLFKESD